MNKRIGKNDLLLLGVLLCVCIAVLLVFSLIKEKPGQLWLSRLMEKNMEDMILRRNRKSRSIMIRRSDEYASDQGSQGGYDRCRLQGSIVRKTESN